MIDMVVDLSAATHSRVAKNRVDSTQVRKLLSLLRQPGWKSYLLATLFVVCATAIFYPGRGDFAKGQWALLYLLIISFVASLGGVRPALLASVLSFVAWNYFFLPPYHTFVVEDPKDWLSLGVFLIVGMLIGLQTGRLREREALAQARERETSVLNRFSGHLVSDISVQEMAEMLRAGVLAATRAHSAAIFLPDEAGKLNLVSATAAGTFLSQNAISEQAERVLAGETAAPAGVEREAGIFLPMQSASRVEGVLYVGEHEEGFAYSAPEERVLAAIANQAAAFLERKRLQALAVQGDALREADRLKSTLISSVSHELRTPLASVTATVSNLLESDVKWNQKTAREELSAVQDDLERLNSSIGSLLDLSRLEAEDWRPNKDWYELGEILGTALSKIPQRQRGRLSFALPEDLPLAQVDFPQMSRALENILENALTYTPEASSVRVAANFDSREIRLWIEDQGRGISPEEREKVFEKFYRGKSSAPAPWGTGLGLAVTREIIQSHGGRIWVEDASPRGARFVISLPREDV